MPDQSAELREKHKLKFEILYDTGNKVADRFGLKHEFPAALREVYEELGISLPEFNGDDSWTLPLPARFVVDESGTILAADANADYTQRPEPEATAEVLKAAWQ